jgi:23S rRNA pseudouridine1911/1915/1917 synthase
MGDRIVQLAYTHQTPQRLDLFLVPHFPEFSRSRIQGLIKDGFVLVNGKPAKKAGQVLEAGDAVTVHVPPPEPTDLQPEAIPLDILFENDDVLVLNKPAGMVVHPAPGHDAGTLVNAILAHVPDLPGIGGEIRPGVVHRLDKDTSGVLIVAKNEQALRFLQDQFRDRTTEKVYLALVDGAPPTPTGRVEAPIGRDPAHRKQMAIRPPGKGREAVSEYETLESFPEHTLLAFYPHTGRTHQIRLHCAFLGCPIVGDRVYGRRKPSLPLKRHFLHAWKLTITLPGESQPRTFEAPLPADLQGTLEKLRNLH